mmetsp:Transcript_137027/g.324638  ORF Transcript_137027/g.324638 Transcript_137027/m.324638 type:complete len:211 (+) Transcript_137027:571-1203(+)
MAGLPLLPALLQAAAMASVVGVAAAALGDVPHLGSLAGAGLLHCDSPEQEHNGGLCQLSGRAHRTLGDRPHGSRHLWPHPRGQGTRPHSYASAAWGQVVLAWRARPDNAQHRWPAVNHGSCATACHSEPAGPQPAVCTPCPRGEPAHSQGCDRIVWRLPDTVGTFGGARPAAAQPQQLLRQRPVAAEGAADGLCDGSRGQASLQDHGAVG